MCTSQILCWFIYNWVFFFGYLLTAQTPHINFLLDQHYDIYVMILIVKLVIFQSLNHLQASEHM
jgi:hypothetical protein